MKPRKKKVTFCFGCFRCSRGRRLLCLLTALACRGPSLRLLLLLLLRVIRTVRFEFAIAIVFRCRFIELLCRLSAVLRRSSVLLILLRLSVHDNLDTKVVLIIAQSKLRGNGVRMRERPREVLLLFFTSLPSLLLFFPTVPLPVLHHFSASLSPFILRLRCS